MSSAILRRNSSKQGLQNLLRLTTQWSIEDEEEAARERRRREREKQLQSECEGEVTGTSLSEGAEIPPGEDKQLDFKPSGPLEMEEDEGFSDWSLKLEQRKQRGAAEGSPEKKSAWSRGQEALTASGDREGEGENMEEDYHVNEEDEMERKKGGEDGDLREETLEIKDTKDYEEWNYREENEKRAPVSSVLYCNPLQTPINFGLLAGGYIKFKPRDLENETDGSCTSSTWVQKEMMHEESNEDVFQKEMTSEYHVQSKSILRSPKRSHEEKDQDWDDGMREAEANLEKIRLNQEQKESIEFERMRQKQLEVEAELEEERYRKQYEQEEEKRRMKEDIERRRLETAEKRQKSLSSSGSDGEEPYCGLSPVSPTTKITDRTESLNRSIKKSNSIKKSEPALPISKIDDRLEQYTHAVESASKITKLQRQPSIELPSPAEAVANKKTLFETGEVSAHSCSKTTPCKDTEGLNIGVSDLINQWAKGTPEEIAKQTPSKPTDVTPGDILSKRTLWEQKGSPQSSSDKSAASGKKFKFVLTGHGKYEKVYVEDTAH
ncbi:lymphocyte-specific protein 1 isoform X2 [Microcaecilia unicolor]|uniref:Lymphocyte-specific protein 1 isoform X2 n=1 Tax=Microcaecilia unicolor TaxID=1415580 RepID=A0A6P7Y2L8_9AMPH|nr:lymphocyte-specific protein 1 isoform X2 [Microcaecilia unicolor]